MSKNFFYALTFSIISILFASPPDWQDDPGGYQFVSTLAVSVVFDQNGEQLGNSGDMFAAFGEDGNVRGVGVLSIVDSPGSPYLGTPVWEMTVRSNADGDEISFQYYDSSHDEVLSLSETYSFGTNDILGHLYTCDQWNAESSSSQEYSQVSSSSVASGL